MVRGTEAICGSYAQLGAHRDANALCTLSIPNRLLQSWGATARTADTSYIWLAIALIQDNLITLNTNCEQLERVLRKRVQDLASRIRRLGGKRQSVLDGSTSVFVLEGETISVSHIVQECDLAIEQTETYKQR